uniref:SH3b domain-containing protein n=1 Tax=candidate division WOR-3 bacterium TaxID=2052148 RepID=A0A7C4TDV4_UNCW3
MIIFLLLIFTSDSLTILYNEGNKFYAQGDYLSAIASYEQALKFGINKNLYYNLGNAYFKSNRIGKAIIYFYRARLLSPRDRDTNYNLKFARNYRADKDITIQNPFFIAISNLFHYFSYRESWILGTIVFLIFSVFFALFIIYRTKYTIIISIFLFIIFFYFLITYLVWSSEINRKLAVVVVPEVKAYSGPGEEYKEILIIHDGAEARILEERNGYYLIQLPGGIGGWIKTENVEPVF